MALIAMMPLTQARCNTEYAECETINTVIISNYSGYRNITVHEAWDMLTTTSDGIQIPIDIRRLNEWENGRIDTPPPEGPVLWTNLHLGTGLEEFMDEYADKQVVIYCRSANRSWTATKLLINNGFTGTIYHMLGGINAWKAEGYPVFSNQPPNTPSLDGPTSGKAGVEYTYIFSTVDLDGDDVYYVVSWGCCGIETHTYGPYPSGDTVEIGHAWDEKGTFTISAIAKDIHDAESGEATLKVTMPRTITFRYQSIANLLAKLFTNFPLLERLLNIL